VENEKEREEDEKDEMESIQKDKMESTEKNEAQSSDRGKKRAGSQIRTKETQSPVIKPGKPSRVEGVFQKGQGKGNSKEEMGNSFSTGMDMLNKINKPNKVIAINLVSNTLLK